MSKKYVIQTGDTLQKISHRFYGTPSKYMDIFNASNFKSGNPDLIYLGEIAYIPNLKSNSLSSISNFNPEQNEVVAVVEGEVFIGWQANVIDRSILQFADAFSFSFPSNDAVQKILIPFTYPEIQIFIGQDLILTGLIEFPTFASNVNNSIVNIQGRSKIGITLESNIDVPRQYKNQKLSFITREVLKPYGVSVQVEKDILIETINVNVGDTVFSFLSELGKENSLLFYSTPSGDLIITETNIEDEGLLTLKLGEGAVKTITSAFNGSNLFSSYKVFSQSTLGRNKKAVVKNNFIDIYRPSIFKIQNVVNTEVAAQTKYRNSFGSAISLVISVVGWRKKDGSLWNKNENIIVISEQNYILRETKFLITGVNFVIDQNQQIANLSLSIPEAYSDQKIQEAFWN